MQQYLRSQLFWLGMVILSGIFVTCKRNSDEALPPEARLKILAFHLAGVPDKNIVINHTKRTITIQMPPTLAALNLEADYTLSSNTRLVSGLPNGQLNVAALSRCYSDQQIGLTSSDNQDNSPTVLYSLVAVSAGKLTAKPQKPFELELGEFMTLDIPVENLYGSEPVIDARVTREGSSEKISLLREPSPNNCVWFSNGNVNQIQLTTSRQLQPGRYSLELVQADGTVVPVSQPVLIKKGRAVLGNNQWTWGILPNESFQVNGYNLFEGDVSVTIIGKNNTYQPALSEFSANGTSFRATAPALAPGNYIVKTHQHGQEIACQKMSVLREKGQPVLLSITSYTTCSTYANLPLARNKRIDLYYSPATSGTTSNPIRLDEELQFSRIEKPSESYSISIVPYVQAGPEAPAYFTIPESVPPGTYQVKLQVKDPKTGTLSLSETYERAILVP